MSRNSVSDPMRVPANRVPVAERIATARQRMRSRARRRAVPRGFLRAAPWAIIAFLSPRFGVDPTVGRSVAILLLVTVPTLEVLRAAGRLSPDGFDLWWERTLTDEEGSGAVHEGLVTAARSRLEDPVPQPYDAALFQRFLALPLPEPGRLARVLPPVPAGSVALVAGTVLVAALVGTPGRAAPPLPDAGPSDTPRIDANTTERLGLRDELIAELAALRREQDVREELARIVGDSPALAAVVDTLRSGGALPELVAPGREDADRLRRAAVHARTRGAPDAWVAALEAAADGSTSGSELRWIDVRTRVAALSDALVEGNAIEGRATARDRTRADGGSAAAPVGPGPGEREEGAPTGPSEERAMALDLPEGLPFEEGAARDTRPVDRTDADRIRPFAESGIDVGPLELEPRWTPVIEAYRRGDVPR